MNGLLGLLFLLLPVIIIVGWLYITRFLWKRWRVFLNSTFANRSIRIALIVIIAVLWFGGIFWEVGGKKIYWDRKVSEMCAVDGGVKVYEVIELSVEKFDKWGVMKIPSKGGRNLGEEYYYESNIHYYRKKSPEIWRLHFQIIRSEDNKLLGEAISYARRGGDIPGPWHESSFSCPEQSDISDLKRQVFIKTDTGIKTGVYQDEKITRLLKPLVIPSELQVLGRYRLDLSNDVQRN